MSTQEAITKTKAGKPKQEGGKGATGSSQVATPKMSFLQAAWPAPACRDTNKDLSADRVARTDFL